MPLLQPTYMFQSAASITPEFLCAQGITALVLDIDNTLTGHGSQTLPAHIAAWLAAMQAAGIDMEVVSNNTKARVAPFAARLGLRFTSFACKPSPLGFMRARKAMQVPKRQMALVGDQIFTDALGANLYGIPVLLCVPMYADTKITIRFKRWLEKPVLARFLRRGGKIIQ